MSSTEFQQNFELTSSARISIHGHHTLAALSGAVSRRCVILTPSAGGRQNGVAIQRLCAYLKDTQVDTTTWDFPGTEKSTIQDGHMWAAEYIESLQQLITHIKETGKYEHIDLWGNSFGFWVILALMAGWVNGKIKPPKGIGNIYGYAGVYKLAPILEWFLQHFGEGDNMDEKMHNWRLRGLQVRFDNGATQELIHRLYIEAQQVDQHIARNLHQPGNMFSIHGDADEVSSIGSAQAFFKWRTEQLVILPDAPHSLAWQHDKAFAAMIEMMRKHGTVPAST